MKRIFFKYALIAAALLSLYYHSDISLGIFTIGFLAYSILYWGGLTKENISQYIIIMIAFLSFYFDSYIGLGIAGIGFLAYLGKYGKPVYKTPEEIEESKKLDRLFSPAYNYLPGNIHHYDSIKND